MSFRNYKINSNCVGGKHRSATTNNYGDKTFESGKVLIGLSSICYSQKSTTFNNNTTAAEGLGDFLGSLGKSRLNASKKVSKYVLKNPGRALEIGANVGTAFAPRSHKAVLSSLPKVVSFCYTG